ncbi:MAG TPA: hypothetical protein VH352_10770 [Pseudonocardiaceae bacterium]|nr:hypothetical protein [Pseudonocardiaceae bacterium]
MTFDGNNETTPITGSTDIATTFAAAWNSINNDRAVSADFWPCCRVLADARLLAPQEARLSAIAIGPFRLAVPIENKPVLDFVEVLFPSVIAGAAAGHAAPSAVAGVLSAACLTFVKLYRRGTVFGRGETDRLRWDVLIMVRNHNAAAVRPSSLAVIAALADQPDTPMVRSTSAVRDAIDWLLGIVDTPDHRSQSPLLVQQDDGGLLAAV